MRKHYLFTGFGSSGSKFLAHLFNKSEHVVSYHEHCQSWQDVNVCNEFYTHHAFTSLLANKTYIDVNTHMREIAANVRLLELKNTEMVKILILRDWREILMSWFAAQRLNGRWWEAVEAAIPAMTDLIENSKCQIVYFKKFTTDLQYLQNLCYQVGAYDVVVTKDMISKKVNEHNRGRILKYNDIPIDVRNRFDVLTQAFNEKYILCKE
jgi:hypothetical protein